MSFFDYIPNNSLKILDSLDIKVLVLGKEYMVDYFILYSDFFYKNMCMKQVALSFLNDTNNFILVLIIDS